MRVSISASDSFQPCSRRRELSGPSRAGTIGWADMAADASGSMQGFATEAIPLVVGAGLMSAAWQLCRG